MGRRIRSCMLRNGHAGRGPGVSAACKICILGAKIGSERSRATRAPPVQCVHSAGVGGGPGAGVTVDSADGSAMPKPIASMRLSTWAGSGPVEGSPMSMFMEYTCDTSGPTSAVKPNHWRRMIILSASDILPGGRAPRARGGSLIPPPTYVHIMERPCFKYSRGKK